MAFLSDEGWLPVPKSQFKRLSLTLEDTGGVKDDVLHVVDDDSVRYPVENLFPVYAKVGLSKPVLHVLEPGRDPIWEAVREEAKLEVPFWSFVDFMLSKFVLFDDLYCVVCS